MHELEVRSNERLELMELRSSERQEFLESKLAEYEIEAEKGRTYLRTLSDKLDRNISWVFVQIDQVKDVVTTVRKWIVWSNLLRSPEPGIWS